MESLGLYSTEYFAAELASVSVLGNYEEHDSYRNCPAG